MDYVLFLYGLSFLLLAFVCTTASSGPAARIPLWGLLGFGLLHGMFEWTLLLDLYGIHPLLIRPISSILLIGSFIFLLLFALGCGNTGGFRRHKLWALPLLLIPVLAAIPMGLEQPAARYFILLPAGLIAGLALMRNQPGGAPRRSTDRWIGGLLTAYALTAGLIIRPEPSLPGFLPTTADVQPLGIPIEVIRSLLMVGLCSVIHLQSIHAERARYPEFIHDPDRPRLRRFAIGLVVILVSGLWLTHTLGTYARNTVSVFLQDQAKTIAGLLDLETDGLPRPGGGTRPAPPLLRQLQMAVESSDRLDHLELIYEVQGDCYLLGFAPPRQSVPPGPPAQNRMDCQTLSNIPATTDKLAQGPFENEFGSWVAGAARVPLAPGDPGSLWLRAHQDAGRYLHSVYMHRLGGILITAILALGIADYFSHQRKAWLLTLSVKEAEAETRKLNETLEQKVQERTNTLRITNQQLAEDMLRELEAQKALRDAEIKYRTLAEQLPAVTYTVNLEGLPRTIFISPQVETMFGYTPEEWLRDRDLWESLILPEDRETVREVIDHSNRTGQPFDIEYRSRDRQGNLHWCRTIARHLLDEQGTPLQVHGVIFDVTAEKNAELALKASGEISRMLFEQSPIGLFFYDLNLVITQCNPAFCELIGSPAEVLLGLDMNQLKDQRMLPSLQAVLQEASSRYEGPYSTTTSNREISIRLRTTPVYDGRGNLQGGLCTVEDISVEQQHFEEQTRAQKLESLGLLAGGIAHDFNNILTAILGNLSLSRSLGQSSSPEADELLAESENAALRARDLTQQLLTFAKGGVPVKKVQRIGSAIREAATFAIRGSRSRCHFAIPPDEWPVEVDAGQISQVIQNLVINADQAMPDGGLITITLENCNLDTENPAALPAGHYLHIQVTDCGTGIPPAQLTRIFDPYFTTKQKGSGLGLATSYTILRKHGGAILAQSELGKGSTFQLYLPAQTTDVSGPEESASIPLRPEEDPRRILVMDDELAVRSLCQRILERYGFRVVTARHGREAIDAVAAAVKEQDPFHLVILDLTVPGDMGGEEAFARIKLLDPEVRGVVSSGYSSSEVMAEFREHGFVSVFPKPYRADDLVQMVLTHARPIGQAPSSAG
ncbi:MAG: PAS domain S-box protein [Verrucomicrobia bacterium]|nr:PAS domain S-box protein [Verrucomicrobiota bacterium]